MQTPCRTTQFEFAGVAGRSVVASFDGGAITSKAGAVLLKATDRAVGLLDRFAPCFVDCRRGDLIEHDVRTPLGQRAFAIALGYEDLNDHNHLRHDPIMAVLAGKLEARRGDCGPVAGKSTLNRLERRRPEPAGGQAPTLEHRCHCRCQGRGRPDRRTDPPAVAAHAHFAARCAGSTSVRRSHLRHVALTPAQDRCLGQKTLPQDQARHGVCPPVAGRMGLGLRPTIRRRGVSGFGEPNHQPPREPHRSDQAVRNGPISHALATPRIKQTRQDRQSTHQKSETGRHVIYPG